MLIKLNEKNFQKEVIESPILVLVELGASWCGACSIMEPIICQLASDFNGKINFGKLDIEDNKKIANTFYRGKLPLYLFFSNGKIIDFIQGIVSKTDIKIKLNQMLKSY